MLSYHQGETDFFPFFHPSNFMEVLVRLYLVVTDTLHVRERLHNNYILRALVASHEHAMQSFGS